MPREQYVTITEDTFLTILLGPAASQLPNMAPAQKGDVYAVVVEYLRQQGQIVGRPGDVQLPNELPLKIPGAAFVVCLSMPTREELSALIALSVLLAGSGSVDLKGLGVTALLAALTRIRKLRAEYGERSIVDIIAQMAPVTARDIVLSLHGKPCRYPKGTCQFLAEDSMTCALSLEEASRTLSALVERRVVRTLNAVPPLQFGLVL